MWRYHHSVHKGIAPIGTTCGGVKSGKGDRLIVVDAKTDDVPLRCDDSDVTASYCGISTNKLLLSDSDDGSDVQGFPTALWTWVYHKSGDYHDAICKVSELGVLMVVYVAVNAPMRRLPCMQCLINCIVAIVRG